MRLSNKQQKELRIIEHFVPDNTNFPEPTEEDIEDFFAFSDKGEKRREINRNRPFNGYDRLMWAKNRREVTVSMWREDWGYILTAMDFLDEPREIAEFASKALSKPGIMELWQEENEPYFEESIGLVDSLKIKFKKASQSIRAWMQKE